MESLTKVLQNLNLSAAEIQLYIRLLEDSEMSIARLVVATGLYRPRIMELLQSLEEKELVEKVTVGKRNHYKAASPHVLVERAKKILHDTKHSLPELLARQQKLQQKEGIRVLRGEEGLALCFLDVVTSLKRGEVFYQFNSAKDQPYIDTVVPAEYRPIRDAKEIERRTITTSYVGSHKQPRLERSIRYIDDTDEVFEHNVIQFIYGNKISLLDFNTLTGTIIENQAIAEFQKSIFLTLYKRLKREG
jgi:sugar-specific transcriptional regulator TrmB